MRRHRGRQTRGESCPPRPYRRPRTRRSGTPQTGCCKRPRGALRAATARSRSRRRRPRQRRSGLPVPPRPPPPGPDAVDPARCGWAETPARPEGRRPRSWRRVAVASCCRRRTARVCPHADRTVPVTPPATAARRATKRAQVALAPAPDRRTGAAKDWRPPGRRPPALLLCVLLLCWQGRRARRDRDPGGRGEEGDARPAPPTEESVRGGPGGPRPPGRSPRVGDRARRRPGLERERPHEASRSRRTSGRGPRRRRPPPRR